MFLITAILCIAIYLYYTKIIIPRAYWKKRKIPCSNLIPKLIFTKKATIEAIKDVYDTFSNYRYFGSYPMFHPTLFITDVNLIKQITIKDFDHFPNHFGQMTNPTKDPVMSQSLFFSKDEEWRHGRATLSPAFTSSKMRAMFKLISESARNFVNYFDNDEVVIELEMKEAFSRYTTDVIANCAFGIQCDSLKDKQNDFFKMANNVNNISVSTAIKGWFCTLFPILFKVLKPSLFPEKVIEFFKTVVAETLRDRENNMIVRPDMIHLLMEAQKGKLKYEQSDKDSEGFATVQESNIGKTSVDITITDDTITAHVILFFLAGFDSSASLLSFTSYELVVNPDVQKKLQNEIDAVLENSSDEIGYEVLLNMKYLDKVISETLRKYPTPVLYRECVKNYVIPAEYPNEETVEIEKGCNILIPIYGIHMDPKFFPNPQKFDPERFSSENKSKIVPGSYLPFGSGPRNCIGSRFALLESKALLFYLLAKFDLVATKKSVIPLRLLSRIGLTAKDGFWFGLRKRKFEKCE